MPDTLTKRQRSYTMSRIRSKWTKPERTMHNLLKGRKIRHKMHPNIEGKPDIILKDSKTAIFLHGCFWHKCPKCWIEPKSNRKYWIPKIESNVKRDKKNRALLKKCGWNVAVLWEHQFRKGDKTILKAVSKYIHGR